MLETGTVKEEFTVGNTRIKICDDCCRGKTCAEIDKILGRIAENAAGPLGYSGGSSRKR